MLILNLVKETEAINTIIIRDEQLPFFDFNSINGTLAKDTIVNLEKIYSTLDNSMQICVGKNTISPNDTWRCSTGWACYILSMWARRYPDHQWKVS